MTHRVFKVHKQPCKLLIAPLTSVGTVKDTLCTYINYLVHSGPKRKGENIVKAL